MDQDATWYGGRPGPRPDCIRWRPSSPLKKGGGKAPPSFFGPCLLWLNGRPSQLLVSYCCTAHGRASLYFTMGRPFPPSKFPIRVGGSGPPNIWFLWSIRVHSPNDMSIGSAVFARLTLVTDRPIERPTDRSRYSVCNNIYPQNGGFKRI